MSVPQYEFTELEEEVFDENMDYGVQQSGYDELYNEAESGESTARWRDTGAGRASIGAVARGRGSPVGLEAQAGERESWK
jgi:hypothetical protein